MLTEKLGNTGLLKSTCGSGLLKDTLYDSAVGAALGRLGGAVDVDPKQKKATLPRVGEYNAAQPKHAVLFHAGGDHERGKGDASSYPVKRRAGCVCVRAYVPSAKPEKG